MRQAKDWCGEGGQQYLIGGDNAKRFYPNGRAKSVMPCHSCGRSVMLRSGIMTMYHIMVPRHLRGKA